MSTRYKKNLVEEIEKEKQFQREQEKLHEKYNVKEPEVLVIEKSNLYKFTIRSIGNVIRITATLLLLVLAAIGMMTLLYPHIRNEWINEIYEIYEQLQLMIPGFGK